MESLIIVAPEVVKKPRAFVEETDIFDFSSMKKVNDKTSETLSTTGVKSIGSATKKIENTNPDYQLGNLF